MLPECPKPALNNAFFFLLMSLCPESKAQQVFLPLSLLTWMSLKQGRSGRVLGSFRPLCFLSGT